MHRSVFDKITLLEEKYTHKRQMESILSMHDEVYPVKSGRHKSSSTSFLRHSLQIRRNVFNQTNSFLSDVYLSIRRIIAQRTLYILGILNLVLAGIAIVCVTHAEDHPEYFALVYIAISIFIFYMLTIMLIIILQIIETYQEKKQRTQVEIPTQSKAMIVESMDTKTQAKTSLSRSYTLPLKPSLIHPLQTFSTSTSTLKDGHGYSFLSKTTPINMKSPPNYQSFALTTLANSEYTLQSSSLIKPIPMNSHEHRKSRIYFS